MPDPVVFHLTLTWESGEKRWILAWQCRSVKRRAVIDTTNPFSANDALAVADQVEQRLLGQLPLF